VPALGEKDLAIIICGRGTGSFAMVYEHSTSGLETNHTMLTLKIITVDAKFHSEPLSSLRIFLSNENNVMIIN